MGQNDRFLQDRLNQQSSISTSSETASFNETPKKKSGGTGSFIVGFVFGLLGVLISCCWGGQGAAFRGFLWRLGITLVLGLLCAISSGGR